MGTSEASMKLRLSEVGRKLVKPPTLVKELLVLLDRVEVYLGLVEQSPSKGIQKVLAPTLKAMVSNKLLRHSDVDVRVAVAACLSEITRITAPEVPYGDEHMKEVFQLFVSSFERLDDNTSQSYSKRTSILETFTRVRLCVVMLDLELDGLILEMFRHFIKTIRDYHPENVFACMENIMIRVIEESEAISSDLLFCILEAVRKDNKEVSPVACKLMTKVIGTCADNLRPYVKMAVKSKGVSLADYGDVVNHLRDEISAERVIQSKDSSASAVETLIYASKSSEPVADAVKTAEETPSAVVISTENISTDGCMDLATRNGDTADPSSAVCNLDGPVGAKTDAMASITVGEDPLTTDRNLDADEDETKSKTEPVAETINKMQGRKTKAKNCKKTTTTSEAKLDGKSSMEVKQPDVLAESCTRSNKDLCTSPHHISSNGAAEDVSLKVSENYLSGDFNESTNKFSQRQCSQSKKVVRSLKNHTSLPLDNNKTESVDCDLEEGTTNPTVDASEGEADVSKVDVPDGETDAPDAENLEGTAILSSDAVQEATTQKMDAPTVMEEEQSRVGKSTENLVVQSKDGYEVEHGPPKANDDIKRRGQGSAKAMPQKHVVAVENNNKKSTSKQKSTMNFVNEVKALKGTLKTTTKRKQEENRNENKDIGEELVGSNVKIWWPDDKRYYEGVIQSFSSATKKHKVLYSDGDVEHLVLEKERWEVINPDEVEYGTPKSKDDIKMRGRDLGKATQHKHAVSAKNNNEKSTTTQKSAMKSVTYEKDLEETPKTVTKRKRIEENKNENKDFTEELVGSKVKVWWPDDKRYYKGVIQSFNSAKKTHKVLYSDGDVENLVIKNEKWEIIYPNKESDTEEESDQEKLDVATGKRRKVEGKDGGKSRKRLERALSSRPSKFKDDSMAGAKTKTNSSGVEAVKSAGKSRADVHLFSAVTNSKADMSRHADNSRSSSTKRKSDSKNASPPKIETRNVKKKDFERNITRSGDKNPAMKSKTIEPTKSISKGKRHARETRSSKRKALVLGNKGGSTSVQKRKKARRH